MHTLTKPGAQLLGQMKLKRVREGSLVAIDLPTPEVAATPLMGLLARRRSHREFSSATLPLQSLSNLLWAAYGVNRRSENGRTAPSALNAQEIDIYVALPGGIYQFDALHQRLSRIAEVDARRVTGYQDFVDEAPIDLIYVANLGHAIGTAAERELHAAASAGAIAQNVYLYCAEQGLATVLRAWLDRATLAAALELGTNEKVLFAQTVGYPGAAEGDHDAVS
jgi:SagB-type dehydrogenase family enzyme